MKRQRKLKFLQKIFRYGFLFILFYLFCAFTPTDARGVSERAEAFVFPVGAESFTRLASLEDQAGPSAFQTPLDAAEQEEGVTDKSVPGEVITDKPIPDESVRDETPEKLPEQAEDDSSLINQPSSSSTGPGPGIDEAQEGDSVEIDVKDPISDKSKDPSVEPFELPPPPETESEDSYYEEGLDEEIGTEEDLIIDEDITEEIIEPEPDEVIPQEPETPKPELEPARQDEGAGDPSPPVDAEVVGDGDVKGGEAAEPDEVEPGAVDSAETEEDEEERKGPIDIRLKYVFGINAKLSGKQLSWVDQIVIDSNNNEIYLLDSGNKRIVITDSEGGYLYHFNFGIAGIKYPLAMDVDTATGDIYIAEGKRIVVLDYRGKFIRNLELSRIPNVEKIKIQSMALLRTEDDELNIYIGDVQYKRIIVISSDGELVRVYEDKLKGVAVNIGDLYVDNDRIMWLDVARFAVFHLSSDGKEFKGFGRVSSLLGGFSMPSDIAVDLQRERVIVVDGNRMMVIIFDMDGNALFEFGGPLIFSWPRAVAVDEFGRIYVADNSGIIRVFEVVIME